MMTAFIEKEWLASVLEDNAYLVIDTTAAHSKSHIRGSYRLDVSTALLNEFSSLQSLQHSYGILRSENIIFCDNDGLSAQLVWLHFVVRGYSVAQLGVLIGGKALWDGPTSDRIRTIEGSSVEGIRKPLQKRMLVSSDEVLEFIQQQELAKKTARMQISDIIIEKNVQECANFEFIIDTREGGDHEIPGAARLPPSTFENVGHCHVNSSIFAENGVFLEKGCVFVGDSLTEIAPVFFAAYLSIGDISRLFIVPEIASERFSCIFPPQVKIFD